jgi:glycosyltransferase involved in cell wall biosynthesis
LNHKVLLVTGSFPPNICGVGDYTFKLIDNFKKNDSIDAQLFYQKNWSLSFILNYLKLIRSSNAQIVHFQYPTEGYGYSLLPLFLIFLIRRQKVILTVHEFSNRTLKAKLVTFLMILFSNRIIVTNEFEHKAISKYLLFKRDKIHIINIGSNIPVSENAANGFERRKIDLTYFGHIRPNKGLDSFISLVEKLDSTRIIRIVGQRLSKYQEYYESIKEKALFLGIELIVDQDSEITASILAECKIAYLPFPDGVSSRRGSLIAASMNGCQIVTSPSIDSPTNLFFENFCFLCKNETSALVKINEILAGEIEKKDVRAIGKYFDWTFIVSKHLEVYDLA